MAKQESLRTSECPVARTLESIGERWCLMIIREAFDDVRRFSEFQKNLGLAKNILASRLKHLVDIGIFEILPASDGSAYKEYVLTEKGRSVFPIVVALRQWGERYMFEQGETYSSCWITRTASPFSIWMCVPLRGINCNQATVIAGALCPIPAPNNGVKNLQDTSENTSVPLKCHGTILTCFLRTASDAKAPDA
ncbi:putative transcriptional regulator [Klebsiella pneumoniae subsp. pneumoniae]|uniref:Putative transcriptional regulator n=9 Tax=Gammaproteobacteria TaxID=1236 RepID=A0A377ZJU1_KLEPN|nr:putative transcriptional regulator [Klebsiella pneumoniae subsp. pneumoniae]